MESQTIQPAAGIAKGLHHGGVAKLFVVRSVAVGGKAIVYEPFFVIAQERGIVGVVLDEPVCTDRYYNGSQSFLFSESVHYAARCWKESQASVPR